MSELKAFVCPSCATSLNVIDDENEVKCPSCGLTVIVPETLRPYYSDSMDLIEPSPINFGRVGQQVRQFVRIVQIVIVLIIFLSVLLPVVAFLGVIAPVITNTMKLAVTQTPVGRSGSTGQATGVSLFNFGGEGTAPGLFKKPDLLAVDKLGYIYVTDDDTGIVQRFDKNGRYTNSWLVGGKDKPRISCLSVDLAEHVDVCFGSQVLEYSGEGGVLVQAFGWLGSNDKFAGAAGLANGGLIALSNQDEDDLVFFDPKGAITKRITKIVSSQSAIPVKIVAMTIDNLGNIFISNNSNLPSDNSNLSSDIFRYTSDGTYVNQFTNLNDSHTTPKTDTFSNGIEALACDNQGRVFASTYLGVDVFNIAGHFLFSIVLPVHSYRFSMTVDYNNNLYFMGSNDIGHRITITG